MYPFVPSRVSTSFHLTISPLYSTIFAPLGIGLLVNRPLPAPGNVDRLTTNCFSSNAMNDECFAFKVKYTSTLVHLCTMHVSKTDSQEDYVPLSYWFTY